jgi:hypothetical protein
MRQTEKRTYTTEREVVLKTTCDICGKDIYDCLPENCRNWYDVCDVTISSNYGRGFGHDGLSTELREYDVCVKCFTEKLAPFIESFHCAKPTITKVEN